MFKIAYWKLCLYGQLSWIGQTSQQSQFYRVSLADVYDLLIKILERLSLINSKINLFVTLVNAVNMLLNDVAGVLDWLLKLVTIKSLKLSNCKAMSTATTNRQFFGEHFSVGGSFPGVQCSKG